MLLVATRIVALATAAVITPLHATAQTLHSASDESELFGALASALPGDVIEIDAGFFFLTAPLVINQGVTLMSESSVPVIINSKYPIRIEDITEGETVVLRNIERPQGSIFHANQYSHGLEVIDCSGVVVLEDCEFRGSLHVPMDEPGLFVGAGLYCEDVDALLLEGTELFGSTAFKLGTTGSPPAFASFGGAGIEALRSTVWCAPRVVDDGSANVVGFYGAPGYAYYTTFNSGAPGPGARLVDSNLFGSAEIRGGNGGAYNSSLLGCILSSNGANGIEGLGASVARLDGYSSNTPGQGGCEFSLAGVPVVGFDELGAAYTSTADEYALDFAPNQLETGEVGQFVVRGEPGSLAWIALESGIATPSTSLGFFSEWVSAPYPSIIGPLTVPSSGIATLDATGPALSSGTPFFWIWSQGLTLDPVSFDVVTLPPAGILLRP